MPTPIIVLVYLEMSNYHFLNEISLSSFVNNDYSSLEDNVSELQTNFQDGVSSIYEALISAGLTPDSTDLADIISSIEGISNSSGSNVDIVFVKNCKCNSTSVDISEYYENYADLTKDNFLFNITSLGSASASTSTSLSAAGSVTSSGDATFSKTISYNNSTGILTANIFMRISVVGNSSNINSAISYAYADIYCKSYAQIRFISLVIIMISFLFY